MQVSVLMVRALVSAVELAGVRREHFLAQAKLPLSCLDDAGARLELQEYSQIVRTALEVTGDPGLGLRFGQHASPAAFDALGHLSEHTPNLRAAIEMGVRYSGLLAEGPRLELVESGDCASVRFAFLSGEAPEVRFTAEFAVTLLVRFMPRFVGPGAQVRKVCFAYPPPAHRDEYARLFGGRECFDAAFTGVEFDRAWLDGTQLYHSPELFGVLQSTAERQLARLELAAPAAERVKRYLASQSLRTRPTMDEVARELGMSARSLRRRLQVECVQYGDLVEHALAATAKHMLADPRATIQETAYALGFATAAAFSRAFKRWTGVTPSAYRSAR